MRDFSFENAKYMDMLNAQVLHMDQGACYSPEYLATRNMRDYPSRVAQIVRAVHLGQLEASPYGAATVFRSILSGQGERWQNFGEDANGYLFSQLLGRELFAARGLAPEYRPLPEPGAATARAWDRAIPVLVQGGDTALFLDEASHLYAADHAAALGDFLAGYGIDIAARGPYDTGFALMAHGRLEDGVRQLQSVLDGLADAGIEKIVTVSGQASYVLNVLAPVLGVSCPFEVFDILDIASGMETNKAYIYAGSFYGRYLAKGPRLMELTPNLKEEAVENAREFQPLLRGDRRVNVPNLWQAPLCAEFAAPAGDVADAIFADAAAQIGKSSHAQLVVCDPFAYNALRERRFEAAKLVYFWNALR